MKVGDTYWIPKTGVVTLRSYNPKTGVWKVTSANNLYRRKTIPNAELIHQGEKVEIVHTIREDAYGKWTDIEILFPENTENDSTIPI